MRTEKTSFTQEGFALYIGMDRSQYCKIEAGKIDPRYSSLKRIAKGLEITASELLDGLVEEDIPLYEVTEIKKK